MDAGKCSSKHEAHKSGGTRQAEKRINRHNCFRPPTLLVEGLLSIGPTPSSFYLLEKWGYHLIFFQQLDQLLENCCIVLSDFL